MTKCKMCRVMLPEIKLIRRKQLRGTFEAQRFAWSGAEFSRNDIKLFLSKCTQVGTFEQMLPQQARSIFVESPRKRPAITP